MGRKRAKKCANITHGDDDRISQLPDDILVHIISFLSLKEAAGTSVLSSRWSNLWKHSPCLNFDAHISLERVAKQFGLGSVKRPEYVKWVNCIIRKHKAATLREFRICFNVSKSAKKDVTRWLRFACARHVQRLEFDFSARREDIVRSQLYYCSFPEEFLTQNSSGIDFKSLKVLSLKCVNVTCEVVTLILQKFQLLEKLVVDDTYLLLNLEVCGPSLALKHLKLTGCHNLKSVKVSAPNLTSLILQRVDELLLENVPNLVEVSVDCRNYGVRAKNILPELSCCIPQLEILTMKLTADLEEIVPSTFPELPELNKLVVEVDGHNSERSLMGLTSLIKSCPYLHEFVLKLMWVNIRPSVDREVKRSKKFRHQQLKVLNICGFYGRANEFQLLRYIVKNSVVLEKVIIDPRHPLSYYARPKIPDEEKQVLARIKAEIPQHIELVIL